MIRLFKPRHAAMAVAVAGMLLSTTVQGADWKAYTYTPSAKIVVGIGLQEIADQIEAETKGDVKIRIHLGGSLPIKVTDTTQAVADGVVQLADDVFFIGSVPIGGILRLPMLITSHAEYEKALAVVMPYMSEDWNKLGVTVLGGYVYTLNNIYSVPKVTSFADLKGKKVRILAPEQAAFVEAYGGVPVTIGSPEVASALQQGVVDAVLTAGPGGGVLWGGLAKSIYRAGPDYVNGFYIVNKAAFEKLSKESQARVQAVVAKIAPTVTSRMSAQDDEIVAGYAQKGVTVTAANADDLKEATAKMSPIWEGWAEKRGPRYVEALKKVRAALNK